MKKKPKQIAPGIQIYLKEGLNPSDVESIVNSFNKKNEYPIVTDTKLLVKTLLRGKVQAQTWVKGNTKDTSGFVVLVNGNEYICSVMTKERFNYEKIR